MGQCQIELHMVLPILDTQPSVYLTVSYPRNMGEVTKMFEFVAVKLRPIGVALSVSVICVFIWLFVSGGFFNLGTAVSLGLMWAAGAAFIYSAYYPGEPFSFRSSERTESAILKAPVWMQQTYGLFFIVWFLGLMLFTVGALWG